MATSFTIPSVFIAIDKFSAPVRRMGASVTSFAQKAQVGLARANRAFRRLLSPVAKLNRMLGGFGLLLSGALIIGALSNITGVFRDFEQANAQLSSVMATATRPELTMLAEDAKRLGATTAKTATEVVGLQEAFARLGFETPAILNMTESVISGSIAMNAQLAETAELTGAIIKTFDDFSAIDTPRIIDQMTAATQKSALNFEKLNTSIPIVAGAANAAGIPFTRLLSILGKLSDSGIDASSSATALRNIFLESAKQGLSYTQILGRIANSQDKLTRSNDEFGKRAAVSAVILAKNLEATTALDLALQGAAGTAEIAANKQLKTLNGALTILNSAWQGFILSVEDGNGEVSAFLTLSVRVISDMLSLASGTEKASDKLDEAGLRIRALANNTLTAVKVFGIFIGLIVGFKVVLIVASIAMTAYNIAIGIVTAAQWLWNAALSAGAIAMQILMSPVTLVILGIAALIALTIVIIKKWDDWGAAISILLGPLGLVINLVMGFRRNWDMIKEAFKSKGILGGLKAIGATILDALLFPLQKVFELLSKIPGVGGFAQKAVEGIEKFRTGLGVNVTVGDDEESSPVLNPGAARQESLERTILERNQNVAINIKDETGRAEIESDSDFVPVTLTSTFAF